MSVKINKLEFSNAEKLSEWDPPYRAGVYVIMKRNEKSVLEILYVGESENLSERGFKSHHKRLKWIECESEEKLFISTHLMPGSTSAQRRKVEDDIIKRYKPECND